jgi:hypothetical protein
VIGVQLASQSDQLDQRVTMQSTGHGCELHDFSCVLIVSHAAPPWALGSVILRLRVLIPLPHDLEQSPYADQPEILQSSGQCAP